MLGCYREQSDTWYLYSKGIKYIERELELKNVVRAVRGLKKENKFIILEEQIDDTDQTLLSLEIEERPVVNMEMDILEKSKNQIQIEDYENSKLKSRRIKKNINL